MALFDGFGDFGADTDWDSLFGGGGSSGGGGFDYGADVGDFGNLTGNSPNITSDILGGSYGSIPNIQNTPQATPTDVPSGGGGSNSLMGKLTGLFGMDQNSDTGKMVNALLPLLIGGGTALGTSLLGANAGKQAAAGINRDTQRIVQPSAQEQAIMDLGQGNLQQASAANKGPAEIYSELGTTLGPMIEELLKAENDKRRLMTENLIGNRMATSGVFPQQNAYLAGDTNRAIANMIAQMVSGERGLRTGAVSNLQNIVGTQAGNQQQRRQQGLLTGQGQALGAAEKAGTAPANAATQAALIAAILGQQQPNYRG